MEKEFEEPQIWHNGKQYKFTEYLELIERKVKMYGIIAKSLEQSIYDELKKSISDGK